MPKLRIGKDTITFEDKDEIGQGNEAYVYRWGKKAVKHYKQPNDPSYAGSQDEKNERIKAKERLAIAQTKLPSFPTGLPQKMIVPEQLGYDPVRNTISGYSMTFLENALLLKELLSPNVRQNSGIDQARIVRMFRKFKPTVAAIHAKDVVLADFTIVNNMVVLATDDIYIVDADAAQFGKYVTTTYTARYVDPRICDPTQTKPMMIHRHDKLSDWYAYHEMLFECLTLAHPVFGGTYKPKGPNDRVKDEQRGLKGITVFHDQVRYPKQAIPLDTFPKQVMNHFFEVFVEGKRTEFPDVLFEVLETGRPAIAPIPVNQQLVVIRGKVTATQEFITRGSIVYATIQSGKLKLVYFEDGVFKREDKSIVTKDAPTSYQRFRIRGDNTYLGKDSFVTHYNQGTVGETILVEAYSGTLTQIDTNQTHVYWIRSGQLYRDGPYGEEYIGDTYANQTQFWVGSEFGFGFYRAGGITVGFVFDKENRGINDQVKLPPIGGLLLDSTCVFSRELAWFFYTTKEGSDIKNFAIIIDKRGNVIGKGHAIDKNGSWLSSIRGKCPVGSMLFASTDEGIVKVEIVNEELVQTQVFPDTEPFVDESSFLLPGPGGLYVISSSTVYLLKIQ